MTPEQREAAIERATNAWFYGAALTENNTARERMGLALDAALSEFVLLHRDDAHIEYGGDDHGNDGTQRWVGPWTTQETP